MLVLDVRKNASVRACVDEVIATTGRIDVLVNNAGIAVEGAVEETSIDEIKSVMETNVFGAIRMIQAVLPVMRKQRSGRIVNIGSIAGFVPLPYSAAYCASKHALRGLSESLDHEVRGFGIRVSIVEPGFIRTDIGEHSPVAANSFEPYISARAKPARMFRKQISEGAAPEVVGRAVVTAAMSPHPQLCYRPDVPASVAALLRSVLPTPLFDYALRKGMNME